jgi:hypothetical protein
MKNRPVSVRQSRSRTASRNLPLPIAALMVLLLLVAVLIPSYSDPLSQLESAARATHGLDSNFIRDNGVDQYWNVLKVEHQLRALMGVTVTYEDSGEGAAGRTYSQLRRIQVDPDLTWNTRLIVLSHEAGHVIAEDMGLLMQTDHEAFADATAYLVCRRFGYDPLQIMAKHLAMYKGSIHILRDYKAEIEYAAMVITGRSE